MLIKILRNVRVRRNIEVLYKAYSISCKPNSFLIRSLAENKPDDEFDNITNYSTKSVESSIPIHKLFVPEEYGGIGTNFTATAKYFEKNGTNPHLAYFGIINQLVCAHIIFKYCTAAQIQKYFKDIVGGSSSIAFCLYEYGSGANILIMEGEAKALDSNTYIINAKKDYIYNAEAADNFLVFVKTPIEKGQPKISCFFLSKADLDQNSIRITKCNNQLGTQNLHSVMFRGLKVSSDSLIGKIGDGYQIAVSSMNQARFGISAALLGTAKAAAAQLSKYKKSSSFLDKAIFENYSKIVGVENSLYFTTQVADSYKELNFDLEFSVLKLSASKMAQSVLETCIKLGKYCDEEEISTFYDLLNHVKALDFLLGSSEVLRLYVGSSLFHICATEILKKDIIFLQNSYKLMTFGALQSRLYENLIPTIPLKKLSEKNSFFSKEISNAIVRNGYNMPNMHSLHVRFADTLTLLYDMTVADRQLGYLKDSNTPQVADLLLRYFNQCSDDMLFVMQTGDINETLSSIYLDTKKHGVCSRVLKYDVHGIERATKRNF